MMTLRLRQIALVARKLRPLEVALTEIFGIQPCFRDPAVAEFGLINILLPIGNQFLEIVSPVADNTAAERYLERRDGDGGYMVITQCDDHDAYRRRVAELGVRIAHEFKADGFLNMQLHPRDTGGSFFEIDQQTGGGSRGDDDPWVPAGPDWRRWRDTRRVTGIAGVEIQAADPEATAARWAAIAGLPVEQDTQSSRHLTLVDGRIDFVPCQDGRPEGLAGITLTCADRGSVERWASKRGISVQNDTLALGGMRWRLA